jgi:hypothetical protein
MAEEVAAAATVGRRREYLAVGCNLASSWFSSLLPKTCLQSAKNIEQRWLNELKPVYSQATLAKKIKRRRRLIFFATQTRGFISSSSILHFNQSSVQMQR